MKSDRSRYGLHHHHLPWSELISLSENGTESHHMVSVSMKYRLPIVWGVNMSLLSSMIF